MGKSKRQQKHQAASVTVDSTAQAVVEDRRRHRRRDLHERSTVSLYFDADHTEAVVEGVLLNASPDGLACRISVNDVEDVRRAPSVYAEFWLGKSGAFRLNTRVVTFTPSTDEHCILGLEVCDDPETNVVKRKLQRVLQNLES